MSMTHEKVQEAIEECAAMLIAKGAVGQRLPPSATFCDGTSSTALDHALALLLEAKTWGPERREKAMRWLAWAQGVIWITFGDVSIDTLKKQNAPDASPVTQPTGT